MDDLKNMLDKINAKRREQKLTISQLAEITNISKSTLSKILTGIIQDPSITSIMKISKALGVSVDYLLFDKEVTNKSDIPYNKLNDIGKQRTKEYINDLLKIPQYTTNSDSNIADDITNELKQVSAPMGGTIRNTK